MRHLDLVEPRHPVHEAGEGVRVAWPALVADLVGHRVTLGPHGDRRPIGEAGAVGRVEPVQREELAHLEAGGLEGLGQQARHREDCWSSVEAKAVALEQAGPPSWQIAAFEHRHVVATAHEGAGGRQPRQAGTDHDDASAGHVRASADRGFRKSTGIV